MSFRMRCPKCHSSNLDLEEDQRAFLGGGRHQVLLHCYTCGMILYGEERIQEEFDRQRQEFEKALRERQERAARNRAARAARAAARPRPSPRTKARPTATTVKPTAAASTQAPKSAEKAPQPTAAASAAAKPATPPAQPRAAKQAPQPAAKKLVAAATTTDEDVALAEAIQARAAANVKAPAPGATAEVRLCAWNGCGKPARPNSKYCSRNCSNKNARARHAARKKTTGKKKPRQAAK